MDESAVAFTLRMRKKSVAGWLEAPSARATRLAVQS
jgi:hypothetical protein